MPFFVGSISPVAVEGARLYLAVRLVPFLVLVLVGLLADRSM